GLATPEPETDYPQSAGKQHETGRLGKRGGRLRAVNVVIHQPDIGRAAAADGGVRVVMREPARILSDELSISRQSEVTREERRERPVTVGVDGGHPSEAKGETND